MAIHSESSFDNGAAFAPDQVMPAFKDAAAAIRLQAANVEEFLNPHLGEFAMPVVAGTSVVSLATAFWLLCLRKGGKKASASKKSRKKKPAADKAQKEANSEQKAETGEQAVVGTGKKQNKKAKGTTANADEKLAAVPVADEQEVVAAQGLVVVEEDGWTVVPAVRKRGAEEEAPAAVSQESIEQPIVASQKSSEKPGIGSQQMGEKPAAVRESSEKAAAREKVAATEKPAAQEKSALKPKPKLAPKQETERQAKFRVTMEEFNRKMPGFNC